MNEALPELVAVSVKEINPYSLTAPPAEWVASWLAHAQVRYVNSGIRWAQFEAVQGSFQWDRWDPYFEAFTTRGIRPVVTIRGTPTWASSHPEAHSPSVFPPADMSTWATALTTLVQHYPNIHDWEIWNEPNLPYFWQGTEEEFLDVLEAGYHAIHEARSDVVVWGPGIGFNPWNLDRDQDFAQAIIDEGNFDVFSMHLYFFDVAEMASIVWDYRTRLDNAGLHHVPLAITETNLVDSIVSCEDYNNMPQHEVADILNDIYACFANAGADYVFWFKSTDTGILCAEDGNLVRDGLLNENLDPKKVYWRLKNIIASLEKYSPEIFSHDFESGTLRDWSTNAGTDEPNPPAIKAFVQQDRSNLWTQERLSRQQNWIEMQLESKQ